MPESFQTPPPPSPALPLERSFTRKNSVVPALGWQRGLCGDQAGQGDLAFVGCHFWGRLPLIQLNCSKYSWLKSSPSLGVCAAPASSGQFKPSLPVLGCSKIKQNKKHLGNFSTAKLLFLAYRKGPGSVLEVYPTGELTASTNSSSRYWFRDGILEMAGKTAPCTTVIAPEWCSQHWDTLCHHPWMHTCNASSISAPLRGLQHEEGQAHT